MPKLDFTIMHVLNYSALVKPLKFMLIGYGVLLAILAFCLLRDARNRKSKRKTNYVARLGGLTWKRSQFCRGWLITGDTGSGKTSSGINQLAHQGFKNGRGWGGLLV